MFNIGFSELLIIAVVALIFIGPKQLPDLAHALGRFLRDFQRATDEIKQSVFQARDEAQKPIEELRNEVRRSVNEAKKSVEDEAQLDLLVDGRAIDNAVDEQVKDEKRNSES